MDWLRFFKGGKTVWKGRADGNMTIYKLSGCGSKSHWSFLSIAGLLLESNLIFFENTVCRYIMPKRKILLFSGTKSPIFYCTKTKKKRQFVPINLLAENRFNGEFYWPNVFHYGFEFQSLTWNLLCISKNLQPASRS